MSKKKEIPKTVIYSIPTEAFDKPLLLHVVTGEQTEEFNTSGRFCPSKGEMSIYDVGWHETLFHEVLEGSILVNMAHYSNNYDPEDLIMLFDHRRFTTICSYAASAFIKLYLLVQDLFEVDGNTLVGLNDYGKKLLRTNAIERKEVF